MKGLLVIFIEIFSETKFWNFSVNDSEMNQR